MRTLIGGFLLAGILGWAADARAISATGGNITNDVGGYRIHIFTNSATAGSLVVSEGGDAEVLVVAGGGGGSTGGGDGSGAGGGAGGLIYTTAYTLAVGTIPVTVGGGGKAGSIVVSTNRAGGNGTNSVFGSLTAFGGGGGGSYENIAGKNGGSGGGGSYYYPGAGAGTNGQGNTGGLGYGLYGSATGVRGGGGGGGAGTAGTNYNGNNGGRGGEGRQIDISGSNVWYAGGGGGGGTLPGSGGTGGGGSGAASLNGTDGTSFTGGGGGGAYDATGVGGKGGSGVVIVRYLITLPLQVIATNASSVGPTSATLNGKLTGDGNDPATTITFCWGYADGGTSTTSGWDRATVLGSTYAQPQPFSLPLTGLLSGSTYVYRCHAANTTGSDWSDTAASFTTISRPAVTNLGATAITTVSAWLSGQVTDTGAETPQTRFEYWADGSGTTSSVPMGSQSGIFSNKLSGLDPATLYHFRAAVVNAAGESFSHTADFQALAASVYYVSPAGDGSAGTNWASAFTNLQQAINACINAGDQVCIRYGVYTNGTELAVVNKPWLRMRGGYAGTTPEPGAFTNAPTILTRNPAVNARLLNGSASQLTLESLTFSGGRINENGAGLRFTNGCAVTLLDCTIRSNSIPASPARYGAGLYIATGTLVATGCRFDSNNVTYALWDAYLYGGGAACVNATSVFSRCAFNGNYLQEQHYEAFGGALYLSGGSATVQQSSFLGNQSRLEAGASLPKPAGGAIYADAGVSPLLVDGCRFAGNSLIPTATGSRRGSAVCLSGGGMEARFLSCDWSGNGGSSASEDFWTDATRTVLISNSGFRGSASGAVYKEGTGTLSIVQSLLRRNAGHALRATAGTVRVLHSTIADNSGWGLTNTAAAVTLRDSVVWGNLAGGVTTNGLAASYTCSQTLLGGTGNLTNDPRFVFGYYLSAAGLPLQAEQSPCIDAGSGTAAALGYSTRTTRSDGQADSGTVDLGYHYTNALSDASNSYLYVDSAAGSDANTGWSPGQALKTVSEALARANPGATIAIASGVYSNGAGGETFPLIVDLASVTLKGAGPGSTTLNPLQSTRILSSVGADLVLDGLTLANGRLADDDGAGLYLWSCKTVLTNCLLVNNRIDETKPGMASGAGICQYQGSLTVSDCEFRTNMIYWNGAYTERAQGGALYALNGVVAIRNARFLGNYVSTKHYDCYGGAVALAGGRAVIRDSTFVSNSLYTAANTSSASPFGAALHASGVWPLTLEGCTFMTNFAESAAGGAVYLAGAQTASMTRCVFYRNGLAARKGDILLAGGALAMTNVLVAQNAGSDGLRITGGGARMINCTFAGNGQYGVYNVSGTATALNCIAWSNTSGGLTNSAARYCDSQETLAGTGNKSVDPLFADTTYYHLKSKKGYYASGWFTGGTWASATQISPLIDAGDPESPFDREPDPRGHVVNLGAYGNTEVASLSGMPGTMIVIY